MDAPLEPLDEGCVHLCVDMQRLFAPEGPWATPWMERVLPRIVAIAERHPARSVFTRFIPPWRSTDLPGRWQHYYEHWPEVTRDRLDPKFLELVAPLKALVPPAVIVDKFAYSPFMGWRLGAILHERRAKAVVVTGAETDVCVLATVLSAVDHGYRVILVEDAVCSSSDAGHDALMTMYRERLNLQIDVATTAQVLAVWSKERT